MEVARAPDIVVLLDTARIEAIPDSGGRVWYRFEYGEPVTVGTDTVTKYRATETRLTVNCSAQRARALELHMEMVSGQRAGVPTPDMQWAPFVEHPLGPGVFHIACRALGMPLRPSGM